MSHHTLVTMTCGVSLETWKKTGLLSRELGYYARLSQKTGHLTFLTYNDQLLDEKKLIQPFLPEGSLISALASALVPRRFGGPLASLLSCFISSRKLKEIGLIRSNQFYGSWSGLILAKRLKVPFILRCGYVYSHHYEKDHPKDFIRVRLVKNLEKYVARSADAIIVTYQNAKDYFVKEYKISPDKITVLGNPIDIDLFRPLPEVEKNRDVLSIGRLEDQKNYFALIEACQKAQLNLTLLGAGSLKENLQAFAKKVGANVDFKLPIPNEEIPLLIANHRFFVLPSFYEGNPKGLLEALSCGIPCIASDISEHRLIIRHGEEGLLSSTAAEGIFNCLQKLKANTELQGHLARKGREKILNYYSQEVIAERESAIHSKLLR